MPGPEVPLSDLELHKFDLAYKMALISVKAELDSRSNIDHKTAGIVSYIALFQALDEMLPLTLGSRNTSLKEFALKDMLRRYTTNFLTVSDSNLREAAQEALTWINSVIDEEFEKHRRLSEHEHSMAKRLLKHIANKTSAPNWPPSA